IIKDHFLPPKRTTRRQVMSKYHLIFKHDRAGRLVDAQEFEHLQFSSDRFSEQLIAQLLKTANSSVKVQKGNVNIDHAYMERQLTPLNIFLHEAATESAQSAVVDLGQAIKDLAAANIFPGDLLLKNFGVTRHGRVVFYDYDEVCLLTSCNFRKFPQARTFEDELSAEPWFAVGENDVFPEEFQQFMWIPKGLEEIFLEHHAELFTFAFWQNMQARINNGEVIHTVPYHQSRRLQNRIFTRSRRVHRETRS
ncbi:MAG: isocitrate dehydrogenase kinase/phosphatase-domain containing protein, partial [bacterium]